MQTRVKSGLSIAPVPSDGSSMPFENGVGVAEAGHRKEGRLWRTVENPRFGFPETAVAKWKATPTSAAHPPLSAISTSFSSRLGFWVYDAGRELLPLP